MKDVLEALQRVSALVDRQDWQAAHEAMCVYNLNVRNASHGRVGSEAEWLDLLNRHRLLSMKMTALRDDTGRFLADLSRGRAAANEYLRAVLP